MTLRLTGLNYTRGALVTSSEKAIARWRTTAVTLFAIYRQSSDVIETDMNIITCFKRKEYIVDFKSRKFRLILYGYFLDPRRS